MFMRALIIAVVFSAPALAENLPDPLTDTVSDFADILPPEDESRIAAELAQIRGETGVQIVVVTMDRIDMFGGAGMRIEAYAKALFNKWGVGDAALDNGIMFLVVVEERVTRIALGSSYDAVYDGRAVRVIDTAVLPEFRAGRIPQGIEAGVLSARDRLITPFLAGKPVTAAEGFSEPASTMPLWAGGLFAVAAALILAGRSIWRARKRCPKCGEMTLVRQNEVLTAATRHSSGNGIRHMNCPSCGFVDRDHYRIPAISDRDDDRRSGRGGGGGSSGGGFGGGSSSGGGGTGRW